MSPPVRVDIREFAAALTFNPFDPCVQKSKFSPKSISVG